MREIGGVNWIFVACTYYVAIFSEKSIIAKNQTDPTVGKKFSYFVASKDVYFTEKATEKQAIVSTHACTHARTRTLARMC